MAEGLRVPKSTGGSYGACPGQDQHITHALSVILDRVRWPCGGWKALGSGWIFGELVGVFPGQGWYISVLSAALVGSRWLSGDWDRSWELGLMFGIVVWGWY